jgi:subtilisin family serine protease
MALKMFILIFLSIKLEAATIAIIDTGFDLDHDFLRPKIFNQLPEEKIDFQGWDFFDNSHLKKAAIANQNLLQDILRYRNLKAKGHQQGLTKEEFDWYQNKNSDKSFIQQVKIFKKHAHGTFVAGIYFLSEVFIPSSSHKMRKNPNSL